MQNYNSIVWDGIIKKEARGSNDEDLGEVQEIGDTYVLTQKGMLQKQKFYIPKYLAEGYDGSVLRFSVSEEEAKNSFVRYSPPSGGEYYKYKNTNTPRDIETRIPVIEERLNVSKSESTEEATITKRPVTETKTVDVPVTHEELSVERRPPSDRRYTSISAESPVDPPN
jgi:stress response protein YsnF